jgi:hypothetical protein
MSGFDCSPANRIPSAANTNNATSAKVGSGTFRGFWLYNATAGVKYLKIYDIATVPNPASDNAKLIGTFALKPSDVVQCLGLEQKFNLGLGYALVTGATDTDNTAVAAGDILGLNVFFV